MAFQYLYNLQQNPSLNIPVYDSIVPSTRQGFVNQTDFTLGKYQSIVSDDHLQQYATPLYTWYLSTTATDKFQPVTIAVPNVGNVTLCSISTVIFGPKGTPRYTLTKDTPPLNQWVSNPITTYPDTYTRQANQVGPSFTNAVQYSNTENSNINTVSSVWSFNIQPFQPQDELYESYPIRTAYGACDSSGNEFMCTYGGITPLGPLSTGLNNPKYWFKVDLLHDAPLGPTLPVPYFDATGDISGNFLSANMRAVFTTPYSPSYYTLANQNGTTPRYGYFVVFYKPSVSDALPPLTYPVIYDPANLQNQTNFQSADTADPTNLTTVSALRWLNMALQTSYVSLDELFGAENWLQDTLLSEIDGGGNSTGVDLGPGYGEGWFVMGLVPYNLNVPQSNSWVNSIQDYKNNLFNDSGVFCSGNLTIASVNNPYGTGNIFWRATNL